VALGGEIDHDINRGNEFVHQSGVTDIAVNEAVVGGSGDILEIVEIARIGQFVDVDDLHLAAVFGEEVMNEVAADKTGAAGDEITFHESACRQ